MEVSQNGGTPKTSKLDNFSIETTIVLAIPHFRKTHIHIDYVRRGISFPT